MHLPDLVSVLTRFLRLPRTKIAREPGKGYPNGWSQVHDQPRGRQNLEVSPRNCERSVTAGQHIIYCGISNPENPRDKRGTCLGERRPYIMGKHESKSLLE